MHVGVSLGMQKGPASDVRLAAHILTRYRPGAAQAFWRQATAEGPQVFACQKVPSQLRRSPSGFIGCGATQRSGHPIGMQLLQSVWHGCVMGMSWPFSDATVIQENEHCNPTQ